jgi:indolepyruvate decarboxylase
MKTTVGDFLISRLKEVGIGHVFGVPGDFNLQFLDQIGRDGGLGFVGCCNELNAGYAADGYARLRGASALLLTYGVGDLSALCAIAGAAAEHVPVICITGAPPLEKMRKGLPLHHTLGEGNYTDVMTCLAQFTAAQARLTPETAAAEIDRVIRTAVEARRPVYLQLPSDVSHVEIEAPEGPLRFDGGTSAARLEAAVSHLARLWDAATAPAILVDMDAERFGYAGELLALAEATGTRFAALTTGKAILPEAHELSCGLYGGAASAPEARALVEGSDCLIAAAPRLIEVTSGHFTARLPETTVTLGAQSVEIAGETWYGVEPKALLATFLARFPAAPRRSANRRNAAGEAAFGGAAPLTQARLWPRMANFIRPGDVVLAESGTSSLGLGREILPADVQYIASTIWGAIGYTLPATLGTCLAAPERRSLHFIGDGSFQLTAQELSTLLRLDRKPVIFLLNNRGYTIERFILGMTDAYNDVASWDYAALPTVLSDGAKFHVRVARTEAELDAALALAEDADRLVLVELRLDAFDAPEMLHRFGPATAEFDYGPLGPQRVQGA